MRGNSPRRAAWVSRVEHEHVADASEGRRDPDRTGACGDRRWVSGHALRCHGERLRIDSQHDTRHVAQHPHGALAARHRARDGEIWHHVRDLVRRLFDPCECIGWRERRGCVLTVCSREEHGGDRSCDGERGDTGADEELAPSQQTAACERRAAGTAPETPSASRARLDQLTAGGVAICGILGHAFGQDGVECVGDRWRRVVDVCPERAHQRVGPERRLPGEAFVEDAGERVLVRWRPDRFALDLLGRDVVRGADELARLGEPRVRGRLFGQPEVGEVDVVALLGVEEDVAGLDVPVDEPARVGGVEGARDLAEDLERPGRLECALRRRGAP